MSQVRNWLVSAVCEIMPSKKEKVCYLARKIGFMAVPDTAQRQGSGPPSSARW